MAARIRNPRRKAVKRTPDRKHASAKQADTAAYVAETTADMHALDSLGVDPEAKAKRKPARSVLQRVLLGIGITLGAMVAIVGIAVVVLYGRMSKPGTYTFIPEEETAVSTPAALPSEMPTTPEDVASAPIASPALPAQQGSGQADPGQAEMPGQTEDDVEEEMDPETDLGLDKLDLSEIYPQTQLNAVQQAVIAAQNANKSDSVNILLVGVDRRGTRGDSNADVIMVATLDKHNKRLKLISILRDCYVPIPGVGGGRINSAAAHGGIPLLMQTVNDMLQLELANYVLVDFRMFEDIVGRMGGVTIRMTAEEISAANDVIAGLNKQRGVDYLWDGFIFAEAGNVRLTGQQALAYSRVRKIDSDFSRTNRQFKVLNAIYAQFRNKNAAQQLALVYDLLPLVETDLSAVQIADIATTALSMDVAGLQHEQVPFEGYYRSGSVNRKSALALDLPMNAWKAHSFMYLFAGLPEEAKLLSGGPSLPPRTPAPTLSPEEQQLWEQAGEVVVPEESMPLPTPTTSQPYYTWRSGAPTPLPAG